MALSNTFFNTTNSQMLQKKPSTQKAFKETQFFRAGNSFLKHFDIYARRRGLTLGTEILL